MGLNKREKAMAMDIYNRQTELNIYAPKTVAILGCGGIGSWVALNFALVGSEKIIIVDPDIIEEHNLNRTPFKHEDIGEDKVLGILTVISELRPNTKVIAYGKKVEEVEDLIILDKPDIVIDCRDRVSPCKLPIDIKGGYDGMSLTIHRKPDYSKVFGETAGGYTVVPSWVVPAQLVANLITAIICAEGKPEKEKVTTITVLDLLKIL
jgi:hypothetical protein